MREIRTLMSEIPEEERPRERLLAHGGGSLSEAELVAVLLRTGRMGTPVMDLARQLLEESGGLSGLQAARPGLLRRGGIGGAKAACLLAALEIGRRLARSEFSERDPMTRPAEVASYLHLRYGGTDQEVMGALYLDVKNRLLVEREVFRGTLWKASVEPRAILKAGLLADAAGMVIFHTHPSGDPTPSLEDLMFTRRLADAGDLVGVKLLDHLIVGGRSRWISLKESRPW